MKNKFLCFALLLCFFAALYLTGCSSSSDSAGGPEVSAANSEEASGDNEKGETETDDSSDFPHEGSPRDATPQVLDTVAGGTEVNANEYATIDSSYSSEGYFTMEYLGSAEKVKLMVVGPDGTQYIYLVSGIQGMQVYPLTSGSGYYMISVFECVDLSKDEYVTVHFAEFEAQIADEFRPALYPNQYTNYNTETQAVAKAAELAADCYSDLEVVHKVYRFIIGHVTYDTAKAETVQYGYLPTVDTTLETGLGICFDYAALMTAMLRSQRIPTRLEVGFAGQAYHAWISTYITDIGWVDGIIQFDGSGWTLVDPTLGANNDKEGVEKFIGSGTQYTTQFIY